MFGFFWGREVLEVGIDSEYFVFGFLHSMLFSFLLLSWGNLLATDSKQLLRCIIQLYQLLVVLFLIWKVAQDGGMILIYGLVIRMVKLRPLVQIPPLYRSILVKALFHFLLGLHQTIIVLPLTDWCIVSMGFAGVDEAVFVSG